MHTRTYACTHTHTIEALVRRSSVHICVCVHIHDARTHTCTHTHIPGTPTHICSHTHTCTNTHTFEAEDVKGVERERASAHIHTHLTHTHTFDTYTHITYTHI